MLSSWAAANEEVKRTLRYVEALSDARTTLADFFSICYRRRPLISNTVIIAAIKPA